MENEFRPIYYQFSLDINFGDYSNSKQLLSSPISQNAFWKHVILPIGNFRIAATVFDSHGSFVTETIATCDIQISTMNACVDFRNDIIERYFENTDAFVSKWKKFNFIFQASFSMLSLINNNKINNYNSSISNPNCLYLQVKDVIDVLYQQFGSHTTDLCQSEYVLVCF